MKCKNLHAINLSGEAQLKLKIWQVTILGTKESFLTIIFNSQAVIFYYRAINSIKIYLHNSYNSFLICGDLSLGKVSDTERD